MTEKPIILAVETSGRVGSVALAQGPNLLDQSSFSGLMMHSSELFPAILNLLARFRKHPSDIHQVYISVGPGSFTGIRIAVALAKTMHLAAAVEIVAVDTLDIIAANIKKYVKETGADITGTAAAVLDAKRGQFFAAAYQLDHDHAGGILCTKSMPDCLITAPQLIAKLAAHSQPLWLLGEGLVYHKDAFVAENIHFLPEVYWGPQAAMVHQLGWNLAQQKSFADPLTLQPFYLRRPEPEEIFQHRHPDPKT
jgi:tRNA threonylcarbamoyladenosine biosynthesis protein TsaB